MDASVRYGGSATPGAACTAVPRHSGNMEGRRLAQRTTAGEKEDGKARRVPLLALAVPGWRDGARGAGGALPLPGRMTPQVV
jgi:hypothetical protein